MDRRRSGTKTAPLHSRQGAGGIPAMVPGPSHAGSVDPLFERYASNGHSIEAQRNCSQVYSSVSRKGWRTKSGSADQPDGAAGFAVDADAIAPASDSGEFRMSTWIRIAVAETIVLGGNVRLSRLGRSGWHLWR
ncbi:hypothetical protein D3C76_1451340 [compost metagenome]